MAIDIREQLQTTMKSMSSSLKQLDRVNSQLENAREDDNVNHTSGLGNFINEIIAGFEALTVVIDNAQSNIKGSISPTVAVSGTQLLAAIAQLNELILIDLPKIGNKLIVALQENNATSVSAITEDEESGEKALNHVLIALPTPEAVTAGLRAIPVVGQTITNDELKEAAKKITKDTPTYNSAKDQSPPVSVSGSEDTKSPLGGDGMYEISDESIERAIGEVIGSGKSISKQLDQITKNIQSAVGTALQSLQEFEFPGVLQGGVEEMTNNARSKISSLAGDGGIGGDAVNSITKLVGQKNFSQAASTLKPYTAVDGVETDLEEIQFELETIDNSGFTNVVTASAGDLPAAATATNFTNLSATWRGVNTNPQTYTSINSVEEMVAELANVQREITEVIIHSSMTGINQNLQISDLAEVMARVLNRAMPYHYVITRSGIIQRGRPIEQELDTVLSNGHNQRSIHVCLIGGINRPVSGNTIQEEVNAAISGNSFTQPQWAALKDLIYAVKNSIAGIEVLGHNDIDLSQRDPGFNVRDWMATTFGSRPFLDSPQLQSPPTRAEVSANIQPGPQSEDQQAENEANELNAQISFFI